MGVYVHREGVWLDSFDYPPYGGIMIQIGRERAVCGSHHCLVASMTFHHLHLELQINDSNVEIRD
jgi:hypothetical protein